jgi:tetratricopeptide (TPR) repeat protein
MNPFLFWSLVGAGGASLIVAAVFLGRWLWRRAFDKQVRELFETGLFDVAADKLVARGRHVEAAESLVRWGKVEQGAKVYADHGQLAEAAELYQRTRQWGLAAMHFAKAGRLREASRCYAKHGQPEKAANTLKELGETDEAVAVLCKAGLYRAAADMQLESTGVDGAVQILVAGKLFAEAAELLEDHGRSGEAQAVRAQDADQREDWAAAAALYEALGQREEALERYLKAKDFVRAGELAALLGEPQRALDLFRRGKAFEQVALLLARQGEYREAARAYLLVGKTNDAIENLVRAEDVLSAADIYDRMGDRAAALAILDTPRTHPQYRDSHLMRARFFERYGDILAARNELVQVVTVLGLSPETLGIVFLVTELHAQQGDIDSALRILEKAKRRGMSDPELDERINRLKAAVEQAAKASVKQLDLTIAATLPYSERYEFLKKLGQGGMGAVYRARDRRLGRIVAIKLLLEGDLPTEQAKQYFFREAQTVSKLSHPNIVALFDYGEMSHHSFIAMEYIEGRDLDQLARNRRMLPLAEFVSICSQLAAALDYAHQKSVIHRDVKLGNVMVTDESVVKLMDFGLAKAVKENPDRSLMVIGTPYYMAPEQIAHENIDHRVDIYAFGILMFRLLTGHLPFEQGDVLRAQRFEAPPDPLSFNRDIPRPLAGLILSCLEKRPEDRPARASELGAALLKFSQ